MIYVLNIIQHNITINFTITGRKKGGKTVKTTNKQTSKQSEIPKFNRLTTTRRTNRKIIIDNGARLLDYYESTLIRNAQGNSGWSTYFCIC